MSNIVPITTSTAIASYTGAQLALIRRTVAKDTNDDEFNLFISVARMKGLDPFSKQISAIVFNKDNAKKRQMSIITTIDGMRSIAARSGRYRPDEDEPFYEYDAEAKDERINPIGLVKAKVRIFIADTQSAGGWRPATGVAYWDEFAPIKDEWKEGDDGKRRPSGRKTLDGNWPKMPRVMLAKCAEAQALRKAFPEDLSNLYEGAELDRAQVIDVTATEIIGAHDEENRLRRVGASNSITFQMTATSPLEPIPLGDCADRIIAAARHFDLTQMRWFRSANTHPLREFWARAETDALEVKRFLDKREADLKAEDEKAQV